LKLDHIFSDITWPGDVYVRVR